MQRGDLDLGGQGYLLELLVRTLLLLMLLDLTSLVER